MPVVGDEPIPFQRPAVYMPKKKGQKPTVTPPPGSTPPKAGPPPPPPPWHPSADSLGIPDLPADIAATVAQILANDPEHGVERALAYIRGTAWYKAAYFGIAGGLKTGVITGEADYRSWVAQATASFRRYYGRAMTPNEIAAYLSQGFAPGVIEQIGAGHAWAGANAADVQYALGAFGEGQLSQAELEQLGQQQVGLGSAKGTGLDARLNQARARLQRIFEGVLASPSLQLGAGGLVAPSLSPQQKPDVGA